MNSYKRQCLEGEIDDLIERAIFTKAKAIEVLERCHLPEAEFSVSMIAKLSFFKNVSILDLAKLIQTQDTIFESDKE